LLLTIDIADDAKGQAWFMATITRKKKNTKTVKLEGIERDLSQDMSRKGILDSFKENTKYALAKDQYTATTNDNFLALAMAIRDRLTDRWIQTQQRYHKQNLKRVYYLSMEFLIGRLMGNYMYNLGLEDEVRTVMADLGLDLEEVRDQEIDAGLGNGGLGRLAACFLDSLATLGIPAHGYGIRYDYGIFTQKIRNGFQVEVPEEWLRLPNPWEFARPEYTVRVRFGGRTWMQSMPDGSLKVSWVDTEDVQAIPYDVPIPGYKNDVVNTLRLWSARSDDEFNLDYFNHGDYEKAVYQQIHSESISKVLYPNDQMSVGRELRLKQEYFFTAASIADILRRFKVENSDLKKLPEKAVIQLNDTHPTLAIVELMRLLLDEEGMEWDAAWETTRNTFAYTNHTLLPEALESWDVPMLERLLPRHLEIIYEINSRFLDEVSSRFPGDNDRLRRMSLIEESQPKRARMAYLAIAGSRSVNGVSQLHSDLLVRRLFKDFYEMEPGKFNNKTNGITQRRWLLKSNPGLSELISGAVGTGWVKDLGELEKLLPLREKADFCGQWRRSKEENKKTLSQHILKITGALVDPQSLFDVQIKRIHEYKRQMMFCFYALSEYLRLKNDPSSFVQPRTFIIAGKAAPGYTMAKLIIKFINSAADAIYRDRSVRDKIRLIFLPNYCVSLAERIFPASELSEQISLAGTEASGTGNMKFMLNGALTIGTLDGANVEMNEALGGENIYIFGMKTPEVEAVRSSGYRPREYIERSSVLKEIFRLMENRFFNLNDPRLFEPLVQTLMEYDPFLVCADFEDYCRMQERVSRAYLDRREWTRASIYNVAKSGRFSSDRTIREYADDIWRVPYQT